MKMVDMGIITLLFGLVVKNFQKFHFMAPLWWRDIFRNFLCAFICNSVWVRDMSGTRRFWFGNLSADSTQFGVMSDLDRSWIGLESVSGRPTYARYITDLRPTNRLPSVAELRPTRPRTLPDKTDTTPTYNRQTADSLSGRDLSNMFENLSPTNLSTRT